MSLDSYDQRYGTYSDPPPTPKGFELYEWSTKQRVEGSPEFSTETEAMSHIVKNNKQFRWRIRKIK